MPSSVRSANRLEERDAEGIEAREALRGELERVAASVSWRLERIEESLGSGDRWAQLEEAVAELGRRLDAQAAIGEEQVRATERALRKGLASLGERLADSESTYVDAGKPCAARSSGSVPRSSRPMRGWRIRFRWARRKGVWRSRRPLRATAW